MRKILIVLTLIILLWVIWAPLGRTLEWKDPEAALDHHEWVAHNSSCTKSIVGIQPYMLTSDYSSEGHFYEKLKSYFEAAKQAGYFKENTVVVLPEYIGTWLVVAGEKKSILGTKHLTDAMTLMVVSNPIQFIRALPSVVNEKDIFAATIFRMKANEMARIYADVFKELARYYNVTINAGSIVLPGSSVQNNTITVNLDESLYNSSFVFRPDGRIDHRIVKKSFPISSELPFVKAHPIDQLPVYDLPIGKTVVLVCADSWYPESYQQIEKLNPDVVLVNSYCAGDNAMQALWKGYDGGDEPGDVDNNDIGKITEREAWIKYALPGRLKDTTIGANVFLRGKLWDLGTDGNPFFVKDGELISTGTSERGGIWAMCF